MEELLEKEKQIFDLLIENGTVSFNNISETLDIAKEDVFELLDEVRDPIYQKTGYLIEVEKKARRVFLKRESIPGEGEIVKLPKITSRRVKILVTSDWGWGLTSQQEDLVETAIREAEKEDPEIWFHLMAGNFCAGKPTPKTQKDFFLNTYDEQLDYLIRHFPKASFKHYIINSWRELSWGKPKTIGEALAEERDDIKCYGNNKAGFRVNDVTIVLSHLTSDYSYYTISYPLQVGMERYQDATEYEFKQEENPDILLLGGINADFEIPARMPLKKERKNNFYGQALPSLCAETDTQSSRPGRKAMPFVLGYVILILDFDDKGNLTCEPKFDVRYLTGYQKTNSYLGEALPREDLTDEQKKILNALNERPGLTRGDISRILHKSVSHSLEILNQLQESGYQIIWSTVEKRYKLVKPLKEKFEPVLIEAVGSAKTAEFSDTHLGHENERPDLIQKVYQIAEQRKVDRILFCGDLFEGKDAYSQQEWELKYHLADQQLDHGLEIWPKSKIWTDMIRGSVGHETAFLRSGYDIVRNFCRLAASQYHKRVRYLGGMNAITEVNSIRFQLFHPRGGIPIGISYRLQNLVREAVSILEKYSKERLLLSGHLHVAAAMHWKGISLRLVPCLEETTDYLEGGGHIAWLGMWICEDFVDKRNRIVRTIREYVPFERKKSRG